MGNLSTGLLSWSKLLLLPALFAGFTVHELAHALVAFLLGDTSQVERKRLSFNPLRHVSWLGMATFLLIGLGWAKPVSVDPARFRIKSPAFGMFLVSVAGATANFLLALLALLAMTATVTAAWMLNGASPVAVLEFLIPKEPTAGLQGAVAALTYYMLTVNLLLGLFNLLPLPPLDGFQAVLNLYLMIRGSLKPAAAAQPAPTAVAVEGGEEAPSSPAQIHFQIGLEYQKAGQTDEAIARYRQAVVQDPSFALAYYNQGLAYWAKGRWSLAASAFKAAIGSGADPAVRYQAGLRLRELSQAEHDPEANPGPVPPLLEPGSTVELQAQGMPPLDPAVERRVWWHLAIGGIGMLMLAAAALLFVLGATMASVQ
jgi:Zn-dependent protease